MNYVLSLALSFSLVLPVLLPEAFPVPVAVCLGALFYYLQNSTGKILRQQLPSNKDLTVPPQERSEERPGAKGRDGGEGTRGRGNSLTGTAAISSQPEPWVRTWWSSNSTLTCPLLNRWWRQRGVIRWMWISLSGLVTVLSEGKCFKVTLLEVWLQKVQRAAIACFLYWLSRCSGRWSFLTQRLEASEMKCINLVSCGGPQRFVFLQTGQLSWYVCTLLLNFNNSSGTTWMSYTNDVRTRSNSLVSSAGCKTGCTKISTATHLHLFASICTGHMLTQKLAESQHQQFTKPLKSL